MVHTFHTAQEQIQQYIKIHWNRGWMGNLATSFDCPGIIRRDVKRTIYLVFCSGYTAPIFFSKSTKEVSNVQGAWHTPNMLPNMVHGHAFLIIWQPAPREYTWECPVYRALWIFTFTLSVAMWNPDQQLLYTM
jgi:hypothetical protein